MIKFSYDDYEEDEDRTPAYVKGSSTSEYAARSINGHKRRAQGLRVLELFLSGKTYTSDEVQVELGLLHQSGSARVNELGRAGCITMTGETRTTDRGGKPAAVWKWVPGTSGDDYKAWLKGNRESAKTYKAWLDSFKAAGAKYRGNPTTENLHALGAVAKAEPCGSDAAPSGPPANDDFDENDVISWALRG